MSAGGVITALLNSFALTFYGPALRSGPGGTVAWDKLVTEGQRGPPVDFFQPRTLSTSVALAMMFIRKSWTPRIINGNILEV